MNIASMLEYFAGFHPHYRAIICGDDGREFTWQEFNALANRCANALLDLGVDKDDRVAVYLPNSPEYLITFFAVAKIGAVITPFNILFKSGEISYILNNSRARVLIGVSEETKANLINSKEEVPHLEQVVTCGDPVDGTQNFHALIAQYPDSLNMVQTEADDHLALLYTSGTTGQPKGTKLTHGNWMANAALNGNDVLHINDQDLFLTGTPFCHIFFVLSTLGPLYKGAGVLTIQRFKPDTTLELISRYRVTHFAGVPTMYLYMLSSYSPEAHDLSSWRFAQSAAAAMPEEYIEKITSTFGVGFCECYGSTETSSTVTYGRLGHGKPGSIGPVARGYEINIVDELDNPLPAEEVGEMCVKGPGIFHGYWGKPEASMEVLKDGWFHTGDMARCDSDGYYYIVDRKKDMIVSGGYNIYPREVEEFLYQNPKVMEVAVLGAPDAAKGEVVKAFISLREGEMLSEEEVIQFCKERMAVYKVPKYVEFMAELPKNATGKLLKRELRKE
ncbi:MAG: long-chain-fatty-acid--CoA ligase [Desulfovermiculus sp.]|nr:long-chain-fatty-acid--CoA ligase [Desulfovermiculus sp.]